jgi:hypothetical protein
MKSVTFVKHKRDALRSLVGKSLDPEFLEERRMQLDTFVSQLCEIRTAVEFFKHHSDPHLKVRSLSASLLRSSLMCCCQLLTCVQKFFNFEENCSNVVSIRTNSTSEHAELLLTLSFTAVASWVG